jgi:hypothetical protein
MIERQVLKSRKFKAGFELRDEMWDIGDGHPTKMKATYNPEGCYIGTTRDAWRLCVKRGIKPEKSHPTHDVCSIGYSEKDGKWYGWSHRAIFGFKIGDKVEEGDCCASSGWTDEYLAEHPEEDTALPVGFEAKTVEDCKKMAIAFADSVG